MTFIHTVDPTSFDYGISLNVRETDFTEKHHLLIEGYGEFSNIWRFCIV